MISLNVIVFANSTGKKIFALNFFKFSLKDLKNYSF